jgi:hypothetical protein
MTEAARRWRLALGPDAAESLPEPLGQDAARDQALSWLYGAEKAHGSMGGRGSAYPEALQWLDRIRTIFPKSTYERLEADALQRFHLVDLLADPAVLARIEPNAATLRMLLSLQAKLPPKLMGLLRDTVRRVIDEITAKMRPKIENALSGRKTRGGLSRNAFTFMGGNGACCHGR